MHDGVEEVDEAKNHLVGLVVVVANTACVKLPHERIEQLCHRGLIANFEQNLQARSGRPRLRHKAHGRWLRRTPALQKPGDEAKELLRASGLLLPLREDFEKKFREQRPAQGAVRAGVLHAQGLDTKGHRLAYAYVKVQQAFAEQHADALEATKRLGTRWLEREDELKQREYACDTSAGA